MTYVSVEPFRWQRFSTSSCGSGWDEMTNNITVSPEQAKEIFRAINGIGELLKRLPSNPEDAGLKYAITSNLAVIQMNLAGMPRVTSN